MNPDEMVEQPARDTIWDPTPVRACRGPCGRTLPLTSYYRARGYADGYRPTCKKCLLEAASRCPRSQHEQQVDCEPFRRWVAGRMGLLTASGSVRPDWGEVLAKRRQTRIEWAAVFAVDDKYLALLLRGAYNAVSIDTVDRVLLRDGSTNLQDLYPELYQFDDDGLEAAA